MSPQLKKHFSFSLIIGLKLPLSSLSSVFHKLFSLPWNGTEKQLLPPHCEWSQSEKLSFLQLLPEVHSHSFLFGVNRGQWIPERPGSAVLVNTDETPAPLSLREAVEHPLLSHTLASLPPSYLIPFHFRVYELVCMQERAHAHVGEQERENAHSCWCGNQFQFKWFHAFTQVLYLNTIWRFCYFTWMYSLCLLHWKGRDWSYFTGSDLALWTQNTVSEKWNVSQ